MVRRRTPQRQILGIELTGKVNPCFSYVVPTGVLLLISSVIIFGSDGVAILPGCFALWYGSYFYFRRQMYFFLITTDELAVRNRWDPSLSWVILKRNVTAFEFSMTGCKQKMARIRITSGNTVRIFHIYGVTFNMVANFQRRLQRSRRGR